MSNSTSLTRSRIPWIDNVRFFAIAVVVLYHCLGMLTTQELPASTNIRSFIVSFNMPLFFFISGYVGSRKLLSVSNFKDLWGITKHSFVRMILPVIIFTLMLLPIQKVSNPLIYYWFLHCLFRLYLIVALGSLFAQLVFKNRVVADVIIVVFSLLASWFVGNFTMEFVVYFLLGLYLGRVKFIDKLNVFHIILLIAVGLIIYSTTGGHNFYDDKSKWAIINIPHIWLLRQICGACLSLGVCGLFKLFVNKERWYTSLGTMTLGIYLIHDYLVEMLLHDFFHWKLQLTTVSEWSVIIALVLIVIAICCLLIRIIRMNRFTKLLFLGEK